MPVTQNEYLVGRIVETNYLSSRVLLLGDLNSRIPVTLGTDGAQAILAGSGSHHTRLEYLPEGYEFKKEFQFLPQVKMEYFFQAHQLVKQLMKEKCKIVC
jgi:hypothetical protein